MKAIVTGGAGFIGSHIAKRLLSLNAQVIVIDDLSAGKKDNIPYGAKFVNYDVCRARELSWLFKGVDAVFHNAASKKNVCLDNPLRDLEVNGGGTLALLQEAQKAGVKKFIHASTGSVYGEVKGTISEKTLTKPVSYYGVSKLAGESYVRMFSGTMDTAILRYFHVYGDNQESDPNLGGVVSIFASQLYNMEPLTVHGDGDQMRVFTFVDDIVQANINMLWTRIGGEAYNCAASQQVSIKDLILVLVKKFKLNIQDIKVNYGKELQGDIRNFDVDNSKIKDKTGLVFRDFKEGITRCLL